MRRGWGAVVVAAVLVSCTGGHEDGAGPAVTPRTSSAAGTTDAAGTVAPTTVAPTTSTTAELTAAAETPTELAAQLVAAERTVRDPGASAAAVEQAGRLQQLAYRRLSSHAEAWDPVVAALIPPDVAPAFAANVAARKASRALVTSTPLSPTLPAWRIRAPLDPATLRAAYAEAEATTGVPWTYLAAIHLVETRMGRIEGLSTAGAQGPMQFLPSTWAACCVGDVHDDHDAILGAATYLRSNGAPGDMGRALFRYNPDQRYVDAVTAYAANMAADERAYLGYHAWQVFFATTVGDVRLPVGYEQPEPVDAATYIAAHPDDVER